MKRASSLKLDVSHNITTPLTSSIPIPAPYFTKKQLALTMLVIQNSSVSLLTRLSRTPSNIGSANGSVMYSPAVAVFTAEVMKVTLSLIMLTLEKQKKGKGKEKKGDVVTEFLRTAERAVWDLGVNQKGEILKLAIPAALYALQNTLLYTALTNLDAATYQTTYQLKLLSAALFSVLFFKRRLSFTKWSSLFILTLGVAIVQLEGVTTTTTKAELDNQNPRLGLIAILAACVSSGLAGGWFEYILKAPPTLVLDSTPSTPISAASTVDSPTSPTSPTSSTSSTLSTSLLKNGRRRTSGPPKLRENSPSLWARNLQLSVPSLCFSLAGIFLSSERSVLFKAGPFVGFSPLVWSVVFNQAAGGLLVAMVVREADGVAKGFATSIAIVVSTIANVLFFGLIPGFLFLIGALLVMVATVMYAMSKDAE